MAKLPMTNPFLLLRRSLRGQATKAVGTVKEAAPEKKTGVSNVAAEKKKRKEEKFWMRDPKTGNWVPESRVGDHEVDVVDQREKLLPKKNLV